MPISLYQVINPRSPRRKLLARENKVSTSHCVRNFAPDSPRINEHPNGNHFAIEIVDGGFYEKAAKKFTLEMTDKDAKILYSRLKAYLVE